MLQVSQNHTPGYINTEKNLHGLIWKFVGNKKCNIALFSSRVKAGFPSPADDHLERQLDLNEFLIKHPAATYFVRVSGDSMIGAGIHHNDLLIVDRSLSWRNGNIVIAEIDGQLTLKRLKKVNNNFFLVAENKDFPAIALKPENEVVIWGVVTNVIHSV